MRKTLLLLVFLLLIPASQATTYTCCRNFETDNGTLFSSFEGDWFIDPLFPLSTSGNNTFGVVGNSTWVLGQPVGGTSYINKTFPSLKFKDIRNGGLWVYSSNTSENRNVTILMIGTTGYASRLISHTSGFVHGWNRFIFNTSSSDFVFNDGFTSDTLVTKIKLKGQNKSTASQSNITYDEFRYNATSKAKAIITFDDGYIGVYSKAYSVMSANNQKGVAFVPITNVNQSKRMSLSQLTELYNNGWDISSHGYNHVDFTTLSLSDLQIALNQSFDNLTLWGFDRSKYFIAYPFGGMNTDVINETKKTFVFGVATTQFSQPQLRPDLNNKLTDYDGSYYINRQVLEGNANLLKTQINRTIDMNGTIVILFHNITSDGDPTGLPGSYNDTISNFTVISNYLASRNSDIDVITFSDFLIEEPPSASFQAVSPIIDLLGLIISIVFVIMIFNMFINKASSVRTPSELVKYMLLAVIAIYLVIASIGAFTVF